MLSLLLKASCWHHCLRKCQEIDCTCCINECFMLRKEWYRPYRWRRHFVHMHFLRRHTSHGVSSHVSFIPIFLVRSSTAEVIDDIGLTYNVGRAKAQTVSRWLPTAAARFDPGSGQVGFVVDKVALGQVLSKYFGFPCQSSFHQLLHNHPHLSSGAGTIGQKWPQYKRLSPTPLALKRNYI
jgi:hypothetical protein